MGVPLVFLSKLSSNVLSEVFCLFSSQLLKKGAIERLPISIPKCNAHPGITQSLFEEKMSILSPNILKYFKSVKAIFEVDTRRVGAMATGLQSKPSPTVITKKDARLTIDGLRGGQVSTNCSRKTNIHHSENVQL